MNISIKFSFARQEDFLDQISDLKNPLGEILVSDAYSSSHYFMEKRDPCIATYQRVFIQ